MFLASRILSDKPRMTRIDTDEVWSARTPVTPEPRGGGCPPPPVGRTRPVASFLKRRSRTGGTAVQKIWHICLCFPRTKPLAPKALSQTSPPQDGFAVANLGHPRKPSGLKARFTSALDSMQEYRELFRKLSGDEGRRSFCPKSVVARRNDQHPARARSRLKMSRALGANHVLVK